MPVQTSYPGVYIEEIPSGVRTITGVATSITAFVGRTVMGPVNEPIIITSYADFERSFGGLAAGFTVPFAVRDFFLNGGSQGVVVRLLGTQAPPGQTATPPAGPVTPAPAGGGGAAPAPAGGGGATPAPAGGGGATPAPAGGGGATPAPAGGGGATPAPAGGGGGTPAPGTPGGSPAAGGPGGGSAPVAASAAEIDISGKKLDSSAGTLRLLAASAGSWGAGLRAAIDYKTKETPTATAPRNTFNLLVWLVDPVTGRTLKTESYMNVSRVTSAARNIQRVLANGSDLVTASDDSAGVLPDATPAGGEPYSPPPGKTGSDGGVLGDGDYFGADGMQANKQGIYSLEHTDLFNLLCIPPDDPDGDQSAGLLGAASAYCAARRAVLLVDPPVAWTSMQQALNGFDAFVAPIGSNRRNAAIYFPRITEPNPVSDGQFQDFPPCGALAGIFARTDSQRGVWKAPAGLDASINGVSQLAVKLTDGENGNLNPLGINCLRSFPIIGPIVWGARTLAGADILEDDYKYIPVRRLALYIEESLYRGTQWVVFEPNDEPLWSQIRLNVGAFMHNLFRQGAFQGSSPKDAYFVKCDSETTTQNDIDLGVVNIQVGFAPLKPAEFVIIQIEQMAGQIQT